MVTLVTAAPVLRVLTLVIVVIAILAAVPAEASCSRVDTADRSGSPRSATARDIIELGEIGYPDGSMSGASPLALSPDGKSLAFVVQRADVATNGYCRTLVVLPLWRNAKAKLIDLGGAFMSLGTFVRGLWVEVGVSRVTTPAWSPDSRSLAVLKRQDNVTQAVILPVEPGGKSAVTHSAVDVEDLWWGKDGTDLYFTSRPGVRTADERIDKEGESGWLYDRRMAPNYGSRPRIQESDAPLATSVLNLNDGSEGVVTDAVRPISSPTGPVRSSNNSRAWLESGGASPFAPYRLWVADPSGRRARCGVEACTGRFSGLWWSPDGKEVWFQKREGWNNELSSFYRWSGGSSAPVRTLSTLDVVQNCVPADGRLACTVENSSSPRRIELIDPATGARRTIFDPNPDFASLALGTVKRLRWTNDRGLPAWADLVLPPGYQAGRKLPLIVVQYSSRGFLRGGTGNEYPIYPLAAAGFAVLSFERPPEVGSLNPELRTDIELNRANEQGWAERKSMLSALLRGVDLAIATGAVDPNRVGITGLSDGATGTRFALLNSNRFAAAAISSCCPEPKTSMTYGGIAWAEFNRAVGYPPATVDNPGFWHPMSVAQNASRFKTPLLIQQSDDEYLLSLEALEALREYDDPVELYVFPGEHHVKWQPRHKLAVFNRALDWFRFWLECEEDPDPTKSDQYRRWEAMRPKAVPAPVCARTDLMSSSAPTPPHPQGA